MKSGSTSGQQSSDGMQRSMPSSKMEKEMKVLKDENSKLRSDLNNLRTLHTQIIQENCHEKFDERRVTVLKSQIIQLERQLLLMSEALSSRCSVLMDIEHALTSIADKCRVYISKEVRSPAVLVERSDLTLMVETAESARLKLSKHSENTSKENLSKPLMFVTEFLQPHRVEDVTLLDISMGQLSHINLKHVGKLESKLCVLYKDLVCLHEMINTDSTLPTHRFHSQHLPKDVRERLSTQLLKACAQTNDCVRDLLDLSLLYPSAPWPPLKKRILKDLTVDDITNSLPKMNKTKMIEIMKVIDALFKVFSYKHHIHTQEIKALKEELKFHNAVYDMQVKYCESLIDTIKNAYENFEQSTQDVIATPLEDILNKYEVLKTEASDVALKEFLKSFKNNAEQLHSAVESICIDKKGSVALSEYGEQFYKTLDSFISKNQRRRDTMVREMDDIKETQSTLNNELSELINQHTNESNEHDSTRAETPEVTSNQNLESSKIDESVIQQQDKNIKFNTPASEKRIQKINKGERNTPPSIENTPVSKSNRKPPVSKLVKSRLPEATPKSYTPNTFIPKRTLKLKKSSSSSQLPGENSDKSDWDSSVDVSPDVVTNKSSLPVRSSKFRRSSASGTSTLIKGKPESNSTSDISASTPIMKLKSKSQSEGRLSEIESPGWDFTTDISYDDPQ